MHHDIECINEIVIKFHNLGNVVMRGSVLSQLRVLHWRVAFY